MPVVDKRNESGDSQDEDDSDDSHKGPRLALYWRALRVIFILSIQGDHQEQDAEQPEGRDSRH